MLRVGIMLDSYQTSAWKSRLIQCIQSGGFARITLLLLNSRSSSDLPSVRPTSTTSKDAWLFRLYEEWDYRRNKEAYDSLAPADLTSLIGDLVSPHSRDPSMKEEAVDVILNLGSAAPTAELVSSARYGIWSFRFSDSSNDSPCAPLFWELYEENPVSEVSIRVQKDLSGSSRTIFSSQATTNKTSLYRNRNPIYWKCVEIGLRCLRELELRGDEYLDSFPISPPVNRSVSSRRAPDFFDMGSFIARRLARGFRARINSLNLDNRSKWYLAIRRRSETLTFEDPSQYSLIDSPDDRFHADPFLFENDGKTYLFVEDFRYIDNRAVISCCEVQSDGTTTLPVEVLRRPYHLSYPFLFEDDGQIYMVPESKENRTVDIYRAVDFPAKWVAEPPLLRDVYAVDTTIHRSHDKYWMFTAISNGLYSNCDELSVFYAETLKGPWTPHPRNPLVSDVRRARPAGALFYDRGRLIRPSQDCSKAYGYGLVFSEVVTLTETEYEERPIGRIDPFASLGHEGTHTYTRTNRFEVVDRLLAPKLVKRTR